MDANGEVGDGSRSLQGMPPYMGNERGKFVQDEGRSSGRGGDGGRTGGWPLPSSPICKEGAPFQKFPKKWFLFSKRGFKRGF